MAGGSVLTPYNAIRTGRSVVGQKSVVNSVPPCCKFFMPCNEPSGTTVTDIVGGVVITPSTLSFETDSLRMIYDDGANDAAAPTSGTIPQPGQSDFILFAVANLATTVNRLGFAITLGSRTGEGIAIADGDASAIYDGGEFVSSTDNNRQGNAVGAKGSIALVKKGGLHGTFLQCDDITAPVNVNTPWPDELLEGEIFGGGLSARPSVGLNEYNVSPYTLTGDLGIWATAGTVPTIENRIQIGYSVGGLGPVDYYGIAMFVFENGIPSDWRAALRWMTVQWKAGNKVIYPNWMTVA